MILTRLNLGKNLVLTLSKVDPLHPGVDLRRVTGTGSLARIVGIVARRGRRGRRGGGRGRRALGGGGLGGGPGGGGRRLGRATPVGLGARAQVLGGAEARRGRRRRIREFARGRRRVAQVGDRGVVIVEDGGDRPRGRSSVVEGLAVGRQPSVGAAVELGVVHHRRGTLLHVLLGVLLGGVAAARRIGGHVGVVVVRSGALGVMSLDGRGPRPTPLLVARGQRVHELVRTHLFLAPVNTHCTW